LKITATLGARQQNLYAGAAAAGIVDYSQRVVIVFRRV